MIDPKLHTPRFTEVVLGRAAAVAAICRMRDKGAVLCECELIAGEPSGTMEVRGWKVYPYGD